jgi:putative tryptophan/tyrosine transport system substrate-binding protein
MRRREFLSLLASAAVAAPGLGPLAARAQQRPLPVIGYLDPGSRESNASMLEAFRKGLAEGGYVEGRNVEIEYRWAQDDNARLPELAADLVRRRVSVIAIADSTPATRAAKIATTAIPIVFIAGIDPVESGLVASLNRPGGNLTGIVHMNAALGAKRLGLLHELLPQAARVAVLSATNQGTAVDEIGSGASAIKVQIDLVAAETNRQIDAAFAGFAERRADALLINPSALFTNRRVQILSLAMYHHLGGMFPWREDAAIGGLMSYGPSVTDQFRQAGLYAARVLKGEKPADLPIMRPTKFELVINLQTARILGIEVPATLLAQADEVIE